jgi:hypothetical protein
MEQGTLRITTGFMFLQFLLYFFKPTVGIDGGPLVRYPWGTADVTLPAGPHTVYIEIPYIFTKIGKATATVNVVAGQTVTLAYRAPLIVFNAGKVTVTP